MAPPSIEEPPKQPAPQVTIEDDVPDPDEDDLDDLDEMLDDFAATKISSKNPIASTSPSTNTAAGAPPHDQPQNPLEEPSDEEFAKQLQEGMADLLGELDTSPEMQAQFENIFKELGAAVAQGEGEGTDPVPASSPRPPTSGPSAAETAFQETIRRTMERMQASGDQATAAAAADGSEDFFEELMKQMPGGLDSAGSDEVSKVLVGMMEQLTNREILYEPMKELNSKFPEWLAKNRDKVSAEDLKRFEEQHKMAQEIVDKFEEPTFSDSNKADREYIVDRMQRMQVAGQPPLDLVGEMPSANEFLNSPDDGCNPQ